MEIKDRIDQFRLEKGLTVQRFEEVCGFSNGGWASADSISERNLIRFMRAFPDVDANWLLRGETAEAGHDGVADTVDVCRLVSLCRSLAVSHRQVDELVGRISSMVE